MAADTSNEELRIETRPSISEPLFNQSFSQELLGSSSKILCMCLITFSIIVVLCRCANLFDVTPGNDLQWAITITIQNAVNLLIFCLALYNRFVNNRNLCRLKRNKNNLIFYFMAIPTLLLAIIYYSMVYDRILIRMTQKFQITVFYFTKIFAVSGIIIIVKDIESIDSKAYESTSISQKLFHRFTVYVAICETVFVFVYEIFDQYNIDYIKFAQKHFNIDFPKANSSGHNNWWMFGSGSSAFQIITLLCLLTFYSKTNLNLCLKNRSLNLNRQSLPIRSIAINATMIVAGFLPMPMLFGFHSTSRPELVLFIVLISMGYFIYAIGILSCVLQLYEVKHWKTFVTSDSLHNLTDRSFVWVGFMGQCLSSFAYSFYLFDGLINGKNARLHVVLGLYILFHILESIQSFLQTVLIEISINKQWTVPRDRGSCASHYCPILLLIGVNCAAFFICLYKIYTSEQIQISTASGQLLFKYSSALGDVFSNIQRLHAVLYFVQMLKVIYI